MDFKSFQHTRRCVTGIASFVLCFAATAADPQKLALEPTPNISLRNEVKHAIDKGRGWLEKNQDTNGFWSTADHPAITALALVALQGPPGKRGEESESPALKKGYSYLLSCAQPDGGIYRKELASYNTSVSIMALVVTDRPDWQPVIVKARKFLISLQATFNEPGNTNNAFDGGIGYGKGDKRPDLSNTALALEALFYSKDAKDSSADVPPAAPDLNWHAAIRFVQRCQNLPNHNSETWASDDAQNKGGFIYAPGRSMAGPTNLASGRIALRSYGTMSYAGLLSYIYADLKRDDPRVTAVMDWLRANYTLEENPGLGPQGLFYYFDTMAKGLTIFGLDTLDTKDGRKINWREQLALKLINLQKPDGSWANDNGRWFEKDPGLTTAYALIALEMIHENL